MNWPIGPARCRSDEYEAEIGIVDEAGIYGRVRRKTQCWNACKWAADGMCLTYAHALYDLLPPRLTLEEAAMECFRVFWGAYGASDSIPEGEVRCMRDALEHYEKMKEEGRV